jgi:hypothetical protein
MLLTPDMFANSANYGRHVLNHRPPPNGLVDSNDMQTFAGQTAYASMVKYVARHVSVEIPVGKTRGQGEDPHHRLLKQSLEGFKIGRVPNEFGRMITALRADLLLRLDDDLYQAAFATELEGQQVFIARMNEKPYQARNCYCLLKGAGYDVHL